MANIPATTDPALILAGIIRQVDGRHDLSPDALAEAILAHPGSCWGPAVTPTNGHKPPVPTDAELEANFRAWFKAEYGIEYSGGLALCDAEAAITAWAKHLFQQSAQPPAPMPSHQDLIDFACKRKHWKAWLEPGGCLENAHFELSHLIQAAIKKWGFQSAVAISPEAGYERIPDDGDPEKLPRDAQQVNGEWWVPCYGANSLAKVLEQAQPPPPAAWPEISDSLIITLIQDFSALATVTAWRCATGQTPDPVPTARVCLLAVLEAAAKENEA